MYSGYYEKIELGIDTTEDEYESSSKLFPSFSSSLPPVLQDFVMLVGFAEDEGPKPMVIFPESALIVLDLNALAVQLMSVDYSATSSWKTASPGDSQMVIYDAALGINAFVHHFTLHDTTARGFVRAFCLAFVSSDRDLYSKFFRLSEDFNCVSDQLAKDLPQLADTIFSQDIYFNDTKLPASHSVINNIPRCNDSHVISNHTTKLKTGDFTFYNSWKKKFVSQFERILLRSSCGCPQCIGFDDSNITCICKNLYVIEKPLQVIEEPEQVIEEPVQVME